MLRPKKDQSVHWLTPRLSLGRTIGFSALILFVLTAWLVFINRYTGFDEAVFSVITPRTNEGFTRFMRLVSYLGNTSYLVVGNIILVIFFILHNEKWTAIRVAAVAATSVLLMSLMKRSFHRIRPDDPLIPGITNFSFPSGHAFMSVAFYGLLICWAISVIKNPKSRWLVVILLLLVLLSIGFSRIYLRVHYATDVLAGWAMGTAWLIIVLSVMDRVEHRFRK